MQQLSAWICACLQALHSNYLECQDREGVLLSDAHIVAMQGGCCGWSHLRRRQRTTSAPQT